MNKKQLDKLEMEVNELKRLRGPLHCAASACEGCIVCKPNKFTEEQRKRYGDPFKFQRFGLIDGDL